MGHCNMMPPSRHRWRPPRCPNQKWPGMPPYLSSPTSTPVTTRIRPCSNRLAPSPLVPCCRAEINRSMTSPGVPRSMTSSTPLPSPPSKRKQTQSKAGNTMLILVINAGSSSLKYQLRELNADGTDTDNPVQASGLIERIGIPGSGIANHTEALDAVASQLDEILAGRIIDAAGHRVVHGGERFKAPAIVDPEVIRAIDRLAPLAPLHNPPAAEGLRAIRDKWPDMPQVVIFDTSFHQTMPPEA